MPLEIPPSATAATVNPGFSNMFAATGLKTERTASNVPATAMATGTAAAATTATRSATISSVNVGAAAAAGAAGRSTGAGANSSVGVDDDDVCQVLCCGHAFHRGCALEWLTRGSGRCPVCREAVMGRVRHANFLF